MSEDRRTLRPPAPGTEERIALATRTAREAVPSRPGSVPPPAPPRRASSRPPDPRAEGGQGVRAERVRATVDALGASLPEPPPPDRAARVEAAVRELARSSPEDDEPARRRVLALGPEALPALVRAFPGALWVDPTRPHRPLRSARQVSAVAACLAAFGEPAVPHVSPLLRAPQPVLRVVAALLAADLAHDDLVAPLAARLWDEVPAVRNAAMIALEACRELPAARLMRLDLLRTLEDGSSPAKWRAKAAWTAGQLRDAGAAALLVEQLGAEPEVAKIARDALALLVGRDLGRFRLRWRRFFARHGEAGRLEWLAAALDQPDADARMRAVEELILLTGEGFERRHEAATREGARELAAFYRGLA